MTVKAKEHSLQTSFICNVQTGSEPRQSAGLGGLPEGWSRQSCDDESGVYRRGLPCTPVGLPCGMVFASWKLKPVLMLLNPQDSAEPHPKLLLLPFEGVVNKPPQNMPLWQALLHGRPCEFADAGRAP